MTSLLLAASVLRFVPPHLHAGDRWSAERTIRFVSRAAQIDLQNEDHFEYVVGEGDGKAALIVKRRQTGTRLPDGTLIPAPPGGEPEISSLSLEDSGELGLLDHPEDSLERTLASVYIAAWNGVGMASKSYTMVVQRITPAQEHVRFVEKAAFGPASLEGDVKLDPSTHIPIAMSLSGKHFTITGGGDRVSIGVEYTAKKVGE